MNYRPKCRMCQACQHFTGDCSQLNFAAMPQAGKDNDGTVIVLCSAFKKARKG